MTDQGTAPAPSMLASKLLGHPRLSGVPKSELVQIRRDVSTLDRNKNFTDLGSFWDMLAKGVAMSTSLQYLRSKAEQYGPTDQNITVGPQYDDDNDEEEDYHNGSDQWGVEVTNPRYPPSNSLNGVNNVKIKNAENWMPALPKTMGLFDYWLRELFGKLEFGDESWTTDAAKIKAVVMCVQKKGTLSKSQQEKLARLSLMAPKVNWETQFYTLIHDSVAPLNQIGTKWGWIRLYGGWPGVDRLETRMRTLARLCFGYDHWTDINDWPAFHALLGAMTPAPIWKEIKDKDFDDARGYLHEIGQLPEFLADPVYLKAIFGVPEPNEVDLVGVGTLPINADLPPELDKWVHNPAVLCDPENTIRKSPAVFDYMLPPATRLEKVDFRPLDNTDLTTKSGKWTLLKSKGGWPGYRKLNDWMNMLAMELFEEDEWRDVDPENHYFLHILGASTPRLIWSVVQDKVENLVDYYNEVMKLQNTERFSPKMLKQNFGVPYPSEVDRIGFGTMFIHPRSAIILNDSDNKQVIANPLFQTYLSKSTTFSDKQKEAMMVDNDIVEFKIVRDGQKMLSELRKNYESDIKAHNAKRAPETKSDNINNNNEKGTSKSNSPQAEQDTQSPGTTSITIIDSPEHHQTRPASLPHAPHSQKPQTPSQQPKEESTLSVHQPRQSPLPPPSQSPQPPSHAASQPQSQLRQPSPQAPSQQTQQHQQQHHQQQHQHQQQQQQQRSDVGSSGSNVGSRRTPPMPAPPARRSEVRPDNSLPSIPAPPRSEGSRSLSDIMNKHGQQESNGRDGRELRDDSPVDLFPGRRPADDDPNWSDNRSNQPRHYNNNNNNNSNGNRDYERPMSGPRGRGGGGSGGHGPSPIPPWVAGSQNRPPPHNPRQQHGQYRGGRGGFVNDFSGRLQSRGNANTATHQYNSNNNNNDYSHNTNSNTNSLSSHLSQGKRPNNDPNNANKRAKR